MIFTMSRKTFGNYVFYIVLEHLVDSRIKSLLREINQIQGFTHVLYKV